MKFKKMSLVVVLMSVCFLGACSNNSAKKNADISVKKSQDISFMNDINENKDRVWLGVDRDSEKEFNKNSVVYTAMRIKNKKVEVIGVSKKIKDLDDIKDDELWEYLVKENQSDFLKGKQNLVQQVGRLIDSEQELLKSYTNGKTVIDDVSKSDREKRVVDYEKFKEKFAQMKKISPIETKVSAKISTDATGNQVISENLFFAITEEDRLLLKSSMAEGEYTYIPTNVSTILSKKYIGYAGENKLLITRKTDAIRGVKFDTSKEKNVKEYSN